MFDQNDIDQNDIDQKGADQKNAVMVYIDMIKRC